VFAAGLGIVAMRKRVMRSLGAVVMR